MLSRRQKLHFCKVLQTLISLHRVTSRRLESIECSRGKDSGERASWSQLDSSLPSKQLCNFSNQWFNFPKSINSSLKSSSRGWIGKADEIEVASRKVLPYLLQRLTAWQPTQHFYSRWMSLSIMSATLSSPFPTFLLLISSLLWSLVFEDDPLDLFEVEACSWAEGIEFKIEDLELGFSVIVFETGISFWLDPSSLWGCDWIEVFFFELLLLVVAWELSWAVVAGDWIDFEFDFFFFLFAFFVFDESTLPFDESLNVGEVAVVVDWVRLYKASAKMMTSAARIWVIRSILDSD